MSKPTTPKKECEFEISCHTDPTTLAVLSGPPHYDMQENLREIVGKVSRDMVSGDLHCFTPNDTHLQIDVSLKNPTTGQIECLVFDPLNLQRGSVSVFLTPPIKPDSNPLH